MGQNVPSAVGHHYCRMAVISVESYSYSSVVSLKSRLTRRVCFWVRIKLVQCGLFRDRPFDHEQRAAHDRPVFKLLIIASPGGRLSFPLLPARIPSFPAPRAGHSVNTLWQRKRLLNPILRGSLILRCRGFLLDGTTCQNPPAYAAESHPSQRASGSLATGNGSRP